MFKRQQGRMASWRYDRVLVWRSRYMAIWLPVFKAATPYGDMIKLSCGQIIRLAI